MSARTTASPTPRSATAKAAAQATKPTKPVIDTNVSDDQQPVSIMDTIRGFSAMAGVEMPSNRMLIISTVASCAVGLFSAYSTVQLGGYLAVGAMLMTGSAFLAWAILIMTTLLAAYVALITVSRTFVYMASGKLESDVNRARGWVTGFFGSKKVEASHA